jgi:hypothetical protein
MVAPEFWMEPGSENAVYGPETVELRKAMGLGIEMSQYDDPHWGWYRWDDGDFWRIKFQAWFQEDRIPSRGQGFNMLLNNVNGMSLGGNDNKIWVDPVFLNSISKVNFHKMFREVSHCYKVDKCNFAQNGSNGQVFKIFDPANGFKKDEPSQLDGTGRYCRYRQDPPNTNKISRLNENIDWDYYCKYLGIPQRAVEYDRNYKCLINDILIPFRRQGILYWTEHPIHGDKFEEETESGHYVLKNTEPIIGGVFEFGQLRNFNGGSLLLPVTNGTIPTGTMLFHYTVAAPTADPESEPEEYAEQLEDHRQSRIFAKVFQYNSLDGLTAQGEFEHWLVEILNDYISPSIRISEFEVVSNFEGGASPFIMDEKFRGFNNGGLRSYMIRNKETGQWEPSESPYELAPNGFYNMTGGNINTGGYFSEDDIGLLSVFGTNKEGTRSPTVIPVPPVVSKGVVRAWGLPGEIITRKIVAWKQPTVVRWIHIQEIRDKLLDFSQLATGLQSSMEEFVDEETERSGLVKIPTPNHILVGSIEGGGGRKIFGTGMVSNGDTPYSDIFLTSDILHARNLAGPMLSYKLSTGLPWESSDHFDESIQDIMSRLEEPHSLTVQRYGYREPGIYTFMRTYLNNTKVDKDVSYDLWIPRWINPLGTGEIGQNIDLGIFDVPGITGEFIGYSPPKRGDSNFSTSTNQIFRIFHPNGMGWWRDAGLLGAGIQWGDAASNDFGSKGDDFKQEGFALINFFRRNIPLNKEVVAAYLRLVPSRSVAVNSQMIKTAGGGRQWTQGNVPFMNIDFVSQGFLDASANLRGSQFEDRIEYEERIIFEEETVNVPDAQFNYNERNSLNEAYIASKAIMGDYNFKFDGSFGEKSAHMVTKPPGLGDESFFLWQRLDPTKTLLGNTLQDIRVSVSTGNAGGSETIKNFTTAQRSARWYNSVGPNFLRGRHSYAPYSGLNTRFDSDEGGNVDSDGSDSGPFGGRGFGFACSSGGWAKDWRVFDVTDVVRLAYAQDRFDANYVTVVDKTVNDLRLTNLLLTDREEPDPDAMPEPIAGDELADVPLEERVVQYSGIINNIAGMFLDPPTGIADEQDENGFIVLHVSLKQNIRPRTVTDAVTGEAIETQPSEALLRRNYIVNKISVTVTGGQEFVGDPEVPENPNYFICLGRSYTPEIGKIQAGWRYIFSKKWNGAAGQQVFEHIFPDGVTEQFREIKLLTNADSIDEFVVDGRYAKRDPKEAPITSPPLSETHDINRSIQEKVFGSAMGATVYTILPIQNPITKIYQVIIHPDTGATDGIAKIHNVNGVIKLDFDGKFRSFDPPKFEWELIGEEWKITGGTYQYCSVTNSVMIPPANNWKFSQGEHGGIIYESLAKLENVNVSILYQIGRGSSVEVLVEAENTGPSYDVDPEAINTITEAGLSRLKDPATIDPDFFGPAEGLIPYSVTNKNELQGGYVRGTMPSSGHAFFQGSAFSSPRDVLNAAWKTKCRGLVTFYGEPNMEIFGQIEVQAPAFVTHFDPVTGEALSNGFKNTSGLDETKSPNGGRKPNNIFVELQIGGGATANPSGDIDDPVYRKKQAGFRPELYVFLRERVDWLELGDTTFGLTFDFEV